METRVGGSKIDTFARKVAWLVPSTQPKVKCLWSERLDNITDTDAIRHDIHSIA